MAIKKLHNHQNTTSIANLKTAPAPRNGNSAAAKSTRDPKDSYTPSIHNPETHNQKRLKELQQQQAQRNRKMPETGPGSFTDARANSREMHRIADQMVDKHGALHPKSVAARTAAVAYDLSIAGPAQEAGEAWGNPNSTAGEKAWATGKVVIAVADGLPLPNPKALTGVKGVSATEKAVSTGARATNTAVKTSAQALNVDAVSIKR